MNIVKLALLLPAAVVLTSPSPAANTNLGAPLTLTETTPIAKVLADPGDYTGRLVQVKGKITAVCEMMGCWMNLQDPSGQSIRIKVNDGEIVFPKESVGKVALAEGKLEKLEMTKEQALAHAKHEAEERGLKFDPKSVTGPVTIYQLRGAGAVVLD